MKKIRFTKLLGCSLKRLLAGFVMCFMGFSTANAGYVTVKFDDFYVDTAVSVAIDGLSAVMNEDPNLAGVLLSNDPTLGDPGIPVITDLISLSFNYNFILGPNNYNFDAFYAKVFDGGSGSVLDDFLVDTSSSGLVTFDLSAITPSITLIGLEFQLNSLTGAGDTAFDSKVIISDVKLNTEPRNQTPVPEPGTIFLLSVGLIGLAAYGRKKLPKIPD